MKLSEDIKDGLNLAINESKLNYVELTDDSVVVVLDCIAKEENGKFPEDTRIRLEFKPFGRLAISYRFGGWDDEKAKVEKLELGKIRNYFENLQVDSMYGWEFINVGDEVFEKWSNKLSLDYKTDLQDNFLNTIDLFTEQIQAPQITIDVRIWFEDFKIFRYHGEEITKTEFIERGRRGWDQLYRTGIETGDHKIRELKKK